MANALMICMLLTAHRTLLKMLYQNMATDLLPEVRITVLQPKPIVVNRIKENYHEKVFKIF
jgi:hypothetical protein